MEFQSTVVKIVYVNFFCLVQHSEPSFCIRKPDGCGATLLISFSYVWFWLFPLADCLVVFLSFFLSFFVVAWFVLLYVCVCVCCFCSNY